jgi:hypothetical protein
MSATKALTKSVQHTVTPELRTSTTLGRRRRKKVSEFILASSNSPSLGRFATGLGNSGCCPFGISHLKCSPKNLKHFSSKVKCLALYQVLTKNFTQKAEMVEMLKCHFAPWPLRYDCRSGPLTGRRSEMLRNPSVSCFEKIQLPFGS